MTDLTVKEELRLCSETVTKKPQFYPIPLDTQLSEDYLARRFSRSVKRIPDITFEFTKSPDLLQQYYHLREEMFISVWGLKSFCGQKDEFDDTSHVQLACKGNHCIAGGRLTVASPLMPQLMPMEGDDMKLASLFPELDLRNRTYGEFSRLAILPEFRAGAIFPEIARRFIKKAIDLGVEYAFNIAPQPLARSYNQAVHLFGLTWEARHDVVIPEREEYEGIRMVLSVMDLTRFSYSRRVEKVQVDEMAD